MTMKLAILALGFPLLFLLHKAEKSSFVFKPYFANSK